jgi:predicted RNA-binding Zn-ribbon protein involved in translation (DUF1610 family)
LVKNLTSIHKDAVVCPRCGRYYMPYTAALSRVDNNTKICSDCGQLEAIEQMLGFWPPAVGKKYWEENNESSN